MQAPCGRPIRFAIADNPMARGQATDRTACDYCAATFQGLFRALVHPATAVTETACEAMGNPSCLFDIRWSDRFGPTDGRRPDRGSPSGA
ncbi:V4R domain-containing protein [Neoroseomonas marina]|nr:V4R domain-containing protein [Neoroseomonas marina]